MSKDIDSGDEDKTPGSVSVVIHRITEVQTTIRIVAIGAFVCLGLYLITDAAVEIANQPEPAWLTLCLAILGPASIIYLPMRIMKKWIREHIKWRTERTKRIEESVNESRSSSELEQDGTHPDD